MNDTELLDLAGRLAAEAGAIILDVRRTGFDVARKDDDSPVTAADHAAEAAIARGLRDAMPGVLVVAEEEVAGGFVCSARPEYWLIDPLDGTREFAAGHDEFTVNLALVRDGRPVLAVVGVPALGETFSGIVGQGAWREANGVRMPISARMPPVEGLAVATSRRSGHDPRVAAFLHGRPVASHAHYGSSLKFCRVAMGAADCYPRFGRTMEWDTAAGQAVLEAAGGQVVTLGGETLGYGKTGWENPDFVAWGARSPNRQSVVGA